MHRPEVTKLGDKRYQVDLRGWICPYPKYAVGGLVMKLGPGERMDLLVDCPAATGDVPRVAGEMGCVVPEVCQIGDGEWRITIELPRAG